MKRRFPRIFTRFWFLSLLLGIGFLVIWAISQRITTPAMPSTFAVQAALSKRIPRINMSEVQFRDKLDFLSDRSEEHTSELQSRQYLVCRLLLEKKKTKILTVRCSI